jgi:hypothetical protein
MTVSEDEVLSIGNSVLYEFTKCERDKVIYELKKTLRDAPQPKKRELKSLNDLNDSELEVAINGFLDKLVFAVNLPNESDLGEIIKSEISGDKFKLIDVDFIFNDFQVFISNLRKESKVRSLSQDDGETFFNEEQQKLTKLSMAFSNSEYRKKVQELGIEFKQPITKELQDFLAPDKQILNLIVTEKDTSVFEKVRIFLETVAVDDSKNHGLSSLFKSFKIESLKSEDDFNLLLVLKLCNAKQKKSKELYNQLSNIMKNRFNQKIILISQENASKDPQSLHSLFKKNFESKYIEHMIKASDPSSLLEEIVKGFLTPKKRVFNFIALKETRLSAIKVHQSLQHVSKNILDYEKRDSCIFENLKNLLSLQESLVLTFESQSSVHLLAIECDMSLDGIEVHKLLSELFLVLAKNSNKQIILITTEEKALDNLFAAIKKYFTENEYKNNLSDEQRKSFEVLLGKKYVDETKDIDPKFSDLTDKSQNSLLEKEVSFQGEAKQLNKLIGVKNIQHLSKDELDQLDKSVDPKALVELITRESISVGNALPH